MQHREKSSTLAKLSLFKQFLAKNNFPQNLPDYDQQAYWDARYEIQQQEVYDWYVEPKLLKQLLCQFISPKTNVLELGSGKSAILDNLYKWGFKNLTGSDFSWTLINQKKSQQRYLKRGIKWQRIDISKQWATHNVDCIIQKAVIDCLAPRDIKKAMDDIYEALSINGIFFHISNAKPQKRISLLKKWDVKVYQLTKTVIPAFAQIDDTNAYYVYVCLK